MAKIKKVVMIPVVIEYGTKWASQQFKDYIVNRITKIMVAEGGNNWEYRIGKITKKSIKEQLKNQ